MITYNNMIQKLDTQHFSCFVMRRVIRISSGLGAGIAAG